MPTGTRAQLGNAIFDMVIYVPSVTYPTIAASLFATNTVTIPGLVVGDVVSFNVQGLPAHLALENAYVSAANTLTMTWSTDSSGISTGSCAILFEIIRPENETLGLSFLPQNLL
jgi:hypothetical protein